MKILKADIAVIITLLAFLSSYPYILECFLSIPSVNITGPLFFLLSIFIFISSKYKKVVYHEAMMVCIGLQVVLWFFYTFLHGDTTYITRVFFVFFTITLLATLAARKQLINFIRIHSWIVAIQAILGLIAFILVFFNRLQPVTNYVLQDGRIGVSYLLTNTTAAYGNVIRAAGYFDEPGALAFWGVYALVFNKLFIQNKYLEYTLLVGLFSTLSAAYYIQLVLYFLFFYAKVSKKSIITIIMLAVPILFLLNYSSNDDIVARYTTERFESGEIRSHRYEYTENARKEFAKSPLVGSGAYYVLKKGGLEDNPYEVLAKDGILGYIVIHAPLFLPLFLVRKKEVLFACVILFAGYMQRPFHVNLMHFFHIYAFCLLTYMAYRKKKPLPSTPTPLINHSLV